MLRFSTLREGSGLRPSSSAHVPRAGLRPALLLDFASTLDRSPLPANDACAREVQGTVVRKEGWLGALWSEVKGEARAQPGPEDMSATERPATLTTRNPTPTSPCKP